MYPNTGFNIFESWKERFGLKEEWQYLSGFGKVCDCVIKLYDATTLGGYVFSQKHWEMARWDHSVIHGTIAVLQGLPIAGIVFVALEILVTLAVALSLQFCCGRNSVSAAEHASQKYFAKMKTITSMSYADDKNTAFDKYAIELSRSTDPVSLERAKYVANMIIWADQRERVLQELQNG